jgi:hypothetical protein
MFLAKTMMTENAEHPVSLVSLVSLVNLVNSVTGEDAAQSETAVVVTTDVGVRDVVEEAEVVVSVVEQLVAGRELDQRRRLRNWIKRCPITGEPPETLRSKPHLLRQEMVKHQNKMEMRLRPNSTLMMEMP